MQSIYTPYREFSELKFHEMLYESFEYFMSMLFVGRYTSTLWCKLQWEYSKSIHKTLTRQLVKNVHRKLKGKFGGQINLVHQEFPHKIFFCMVNPPRHKNKIFQYLILYLGLLAPIRTI